MRRDLEVNRQVERLRSMLLVHTLSDELQCGHKGYALGLRMCSGSELADVEAQSHKWGGRFRGAKIPDAERESLVATYPVLRTVWSDPLWEVLKSARSSADNQRCFNSIVPVDHPMRRFSQCSMRDWIGVPDPQRLYELLLLLRNDSNSLHLQRLWVMKNLAPYVLVASIFVPFRPVAVPLYQCIRDLPLNKAPMVDALQGYLPVSPLHWEGWVNAAQEEASEWLASRKGRTSTLARRWLWDMLPSVDFQRRLCSRL